MTKIILSGCNGRMGQVITRLAAQGSACEIVAGIDINDCVENDYPVFPAPDACDADADVIVDFSHPSAFGALTEFAKKRRLALVAATTGLDARQKAALSALSKEIPVFYSANMSVGINLLIELAKKAAAVLGESFDIEIVEQHHNRKIDAPSGTALAIADAVSGVLPDAPRYVYDRHSVRRSRRHDEIGIHSVRGGTICGKHDVIFAGADEVITLSHEAMSREVFASGALRAASFIDGKPAGMYSMRELVGELS